MLAPSKLSECLFLLFSCIQVVHNARILSIFQMPSRSHCVLVHPLLKALASQGHEITMISPYPFKENLPNYREIFLEKSLASKKDLLEPMMQHNSSKLNSFSTSITMFAKINAILLENEELKKLQDTEKFDLIILYALAPEAILGLAHQFDAPVILFNTLGSSIVNYLVGNPAPSSFVPAFSGISALPKDFENYFLYRLLNSLISLMGVIGRCLIFNRGSEALLKKHFPNAPSQDELIEKYVSLVLVNSHFSIESVRPLLPNIIPVGGIQIEDPKPLPADLRLFLDGAKNGAIFLSFGSNIRIAEHLPQDKLDTMIDVLGKFNQQVLFKSEIEISNLPKNIKIAKWLPQNDVLAHPNIKLFISHGGLLSTTEAVYHGVPIVGVPFFGDQKLNVEIAVNEGYALQLNVDDIGKISFSNVIKQGLEDLNLRNKIQFMSSLIKNQPMKPLDTALYWVNHVLKYKGADHLKSPGRNLNFFQFYIIDVAVVLFFSFIIVVIVVYYIFKLTLRLLLKICKRKRNNSKKNKTD